jgi:hypothetical protein
VLLADTFCKALEAASQRLEASNTNFGGLLGDHGLYQPSVLLMGISPRPEGSAQ